MSVPGFDKLSAERQAVFQRIPPDRFDFARPAIEREISELHGNAEEISSCEGERAEGAAEENTADTREAQTDTTIDTYHRAEQGDPAARQDLLDQKKELFGEEPTDDEIFQTILETNSSNPFAQDLTLEVALSDQEAQAHQDVLDLFKDFRGDLPSVDDALKPEMQIDLFLELTKGLGSLPEREYFARQALTVLTGNGQQNLREGLRELGVLGDGGLLESGVNRLRELASSQPVTPSVA